jgi:hypothetical protein
LINTVTNLVELKDVKQLEKLLVLLVLLQLDIVLLQTVQGEFSFVIDIDLHGLK